MKMAPSEAGLKEGWEVGGGGGSGDNRKCSFGRVDLECLLENQVDMPHRIRVACANLEPSSSSDFL